MLSRDTYSILFEPIDIGPVRAKNRFYQTPHATGMGSSYPNRSIKYRETKAEGGWGVVCAEECMIHPTSDHQPTSCLRLFSDDHIPVIAKHAEQVHKHGALFGLELSHAGKSASNRLSREYPLGPRSLPFYSHGPVTTKAMDKADIKNLREWHKTAVRRAIQADVDIVYVYCAHDLSLLMQFLLSRYNDRTDEYGGNLENRARLLKEVLQDAREIADGKAAVAIRFAVDEWRGADGMSHNAEARDLVELLADLPDMWDVNVSDWTNDSGPSRFFEEGYQEPFTSFVKTITQKPVVGVGRYTSPDKMASLIRKGTLDMIGAARPSIADPFLPKKIEEGRIDEIRECIGCNMCTSNIFLAAPIRCTQNPTIGMEWSHGWHPENVPLKKSNIPDETILVIGAGPAGLETTHTLAKRGYNVLLADANTTLGGRVAKESKLPGLSAWGRVADYRVHQIQQMANVEIYRDNALTAEEVLELGIGHIVTATGGTWRRDGFGPSNFTLVPTEGTVILSADDILDGNMPSGKVIVFDDEHYYMGSAIAETIRAAGNEVTLVTPAAEVGSWSKNTLEFPHIQKRLIDIGVQMATQMNINAVADGKVSLRHVYNKAETILECDALVMVTFKEPNNTLYQCLVEQETQWADAGIKSLHQIGDSVAYGPIAQAVHDGHKFARTFGLSVDEITDVKYEMPTLAFS